MPGRRAVLTLLLAALVLPAGVERGLAQRKAPAPRERADVAKFRQRVEALVSGAVPARPTAQPKAPAGIATHPEKGDWGLLVADAATGETLYAHNADRYFTPASNTKMFTTALAFAALGPDYRFRTTLETRGRIDSHGRLRGNLVLVGRGDPNLSNRKLPYDVKVETEGTPEKTLAALADAIVARGIRSIEGDIIGDDSYFTYDRYPPGWAIDDMTFGYGAPVTALAINDNALEIEVRPGQLEGEPTWFNVEPWADFYQFESHITTGPANAPARTTITREPGSRRVVLGGQIPLGAEPRKLALAIEEPAEFSAALLKRLLEMRGVRVYGATRARHTPEEREERPVVLAEHVSLPLSEAIRVINKVSQNLHTEMLLRVMAREKTGTGSTSAGLQYAQDFLKSIGVAERDAVLNDGSGLSRMNLITPRAAVALLQFVAKQPWHDAYFASLPVGGEDGTLERRMRDTPAAGRIQAKTGTLGSVNALSGYATTLHGTRLIFSMFGNKHNLRGRDGTDVLDAICVAMVEELGAPPPSKRKR
jgi:D-alanyl-D-alanine carboxypeptidase/D-alanyl-D-alanine-endopeptidase (penicillin-binding protein 4)